MNAILRPVEEADLHDVGELLDGVFRRARGIADQHMLTDFPLVFAPSNLRNCRLLVDERQIVSHAGLWPRELQIGERRLKVGVLTAVATHPEHRQRGYAAQAVAALQDVMRREGYDLGLLWTGVPDFYHKLGWETVVPRGTKIVLQGGTAAPATGPDYQIVPFDAAQHLAGVMALHEREAVRFLRRGEEYEQLLALPKVEVWVAMQVEALVAYLVHALGCNKRGLIEYGGSLQGITALAGHAAARQPGGTEFPLLAYHLRPDLTEWAAQLDLPHSPLSSSKGMGQEMIYAVRPEKITADVRRQLFTWGLDQA